MGYFHRVFMPSVLAVALCPASFAQQRVLTDVQRMEFVGPVKSVSVTSTETGIVFQQPGGPTLVMPVVCRECDFDHDGNLTKSGQIVDGGFRGEIIHAVRNESGRVIERFSYDASTGELNQHQLYTYDQYGNTTDWLILDGQGNQIGRTVVTIDGDGNKEQWDYGKAGETRLHFQHTFDRKNQIEHFTTFNLFGGVSLTWTVIGGKLDSFWESPDAHQEFGEGFSEDVGNNTWEHYDCQSRVGCQLSRIHYEYLDAKRQNPLSAEWRDSDGNLRYAAYYEYAIDTNRNWTSRKVWVWSLSLGERKLYETDSRIISYWLK